MDRLSRIITLAGTAILMNLTFLAFSLPIITIGQSWCGLMSAIRYNIRGEGWFKGFLVGFRKRFVRGTVAWLIGLLACLFVLNDIFLAMSAGAEVPLVGSALMFAFAAVLLMSSLCLNVYIPTSVSDWVKNTVNLALKGLLPLILSAGLFWLPVLVFCLVDGWIIYELALVLICAYFAVVALVTTVVIKQKLTEILLDARAAGILTAEEGAMPIREEEDA